MVFYGLIFYQVLVPSKLFLKNCMFISIDLDYLKLHLTKIMHKKYMLYCTIWHKTGKMFYL